MDRASAQIPPLGGFELADCWQRWFEGLDAASAVLFLSWLIDDPETDDEMRAALIAKREEWFAALPTSPDSGETVH